MQKYNNQKITVNNRKIKMKRLNIFIIIFLLFIFHLLFAIFPINHAQAQFNSLGIATYLPIQGQIEDGDIIVTSDKGYTRSSVPYEIGIIGVVSINPAISLKTESAQTGYPVVSAGTAYVKVSNENGDIKKGDFITSSQTRGTGMKAEGSGFILGTSLEDVAFENASSTKLIQIAVNPRSIQAGSSIIDLLTIGKIAASGAPNKVLQYIIAGIITIVTFSSGFIIFSKTVNTGLEALGRNPLASRQIQLGIIFNIALIITIIIAGAGLAYIVIRL